MPSCTIAEPGICNYILSWALYALTKTPAINTSFSRKYENLEVINVPYVVESILVTTIINLSFCQCCPQAYRKHPSRRIYNLPQQF